MYVYIWTTISLSFEKKVSLLAILVQKFLKPTNYEVVPLTKTVLKWIVLCD